MNWLPSSSDFCGKGARPDGRRETNANGLRWRAVRSCIARPRIHSGDNSLPAIIVASKLSGTLSMGADANVTVTTCATRTFEPGLMGDAATRGIRARAAHRRSSQSGGKTRGGQSTRRIRVLPATGGPDRRQERKKIFYPQGHVGVRQGIGMHAGAGLAVTRSARRHQGARHWRRCSTIPERRRGRSARVA